MPLKFTKQGWYDGRTRKSVCAELTRDKKGCVSYKLVPHNPANLIPMFWLNGDHKSKDSEIPSCAVMLNLILNIARGQRITTPKYQNQFIDRYDKTFFREKNKFTISYTQDNITNFSALGNYIFITCTNMECGSIEFIFNGYKHILGNLALTLYESLQIEDLNLPIEDVLLEKGSTLTKEEFTPARIEEIKRVIDSEEAALEVIQGAFITCFYQDHSVTDKDINIKVKSVIKKLKPIVSKIDIGKTSKPLSVSTLKQMRKLARECVPEIWVIDERYDEIVDIISPNYENVIAELNERFPVPKIKSKTDKKSVNKPVKTTKIKKTSDKKK